MISSNKIIIYKLILSYFNRAKYYALFYLPVSRNVYAIFRSRPPLFQTLDPALTNVHFDCNAQEINDSIHPYDQTQGRIQRLKKGGAGPKNSVNVSRH